MGGQHSLWPPEGQPCVSIMSSLSCALSSLRCIRNHLSGHSSRQPVHLHYGWSVLTSTVPSLFSSSAWNFLPATVASALLYLASLVSCETA